MKGKKGVANWLLLLVVLGVIGGAFLYMGGDGPSHFLSFTPTPPEQLEVQKSCNGVQSVKGNYNSIDRFKAGTDPAGNITIISPIQKTIVDDATSTTLPVQTEFTALAHNNLGTPNANYFAEEYNFKTVCADLDIQPKLSKAEALSTFSAVNTNGVTLNANSSTGREDVSASTSYTAKLTLRSPSDACASKYGSVLACEYDATYVTSVSASSGLNDEAYPVYLSHVLSGADQWKTMYYSGELCNGADDTIAIDYETSASAGSVTSAINCTWLAVDKDLNADSLTVITGIYDEDNNLIARSQKSQAVFFN